MHLCVDGNPRPEEREVACHPLIRPILVEGNAIVCSCPICEQKFVISTKRKKRVE